MSAIHIRQKSASFSVPVRFVDELLRDANPTFVKVYLYALRHCCDSDALSVSRIAEALDILATDVLIAFRYWNGVSALRFSENEDGSFELAFDEIPLTKRSETQQITEKPAKKQVRGVPAYSIDDVNQSAQNPALKNMYMICGQILNKTLNHNDLRLLYGFYDWYQLPVEVIMMLLEYCVSIGKTDMRYIEKVACTWADNNIVTLDAANTYVQKQTTDRLMEKRIMRILQISGRELTETERRYINTWVNVYKATDAQIKSAYETTVLNTGKVAFKYLDTVLKNANAPAKPNQNTPTRNSGLRNFTTETELSELELSMVRSRIAKGGN